MAGKYLPTELQDSNGDIVYPHTEADIVFMTDGSNVEEELRKKTSIVISDESIPVEQRKEGTMYLFKKGAGTQIQSTVAMASPTVGYKLL